MQDGNTINTTVAITCCNEFKEVEKLATILDPVITAGERELVIQVDSSTRNHESGSMIEHLNNLKLKCMPKIISCALEGEAGIDFGLFKNNLFHHAAGEYILQLDADEYILEATIPTIESIIDMNPSVDLYWIPRVNTVENLTLDHINKWSWKVNEKGYINFPDLQGRLYRNDPDRLMWHGRVHERVIGLNLNYGFLPEHRNTMLYHPKTIEKQIKQNTLYENI